MRPVPPTMHPQSAVRVALPNRGLVASNYNLRNRSTNPGRPSIRRQRKPLCDSSRSMDLLKELRSRETQ